MNQNLQKEKEENLDVQKLAKGSSSFLDILRGISAQLVLIGHALGLFHFVNSNDIENIPQIQCISVLVFFILSGFLITYSVSVKSHTFRTFFIDRFSRIYTAFIPAILIVLIIDGFSYHLDPAKYAFVESFNTKTFFGNLFLLYDFPFDLLNLGITNFGSAEPFWSLSIEWWIYIFFGFFIFIIAKGKKITFLNLIILGFLSIVPLASIVGKNSNGLTLYWIFGAIMYLLYEQNLLKKTSIKIKLLLAVIFSCLAVLKVIITKDEYDPFFAFFLSGAILFLVDIFRYINIPDRIQKIGGYIASYSYTLYLIHYSILEFMSVHFGDILNKWTLLIIGLIISNILSIVVGRYFELFVTPRVKSFLKDRRPLTFPQIKIAKL